MTVQSLGKLMTLEEHHERLARAARDAIGRLDRTGHVALSVIDELRDLLTTPHADEESADAMLRVACQTLVADLAAPLSLIEASIAQDAADLPGRAEACTAIRTRLQPVVAAVAETRRTRASIWTAALVTASAAEGAGSTRTVGWFLSLADAKRYLARPEVWRPGEARVVIEQVAAGAFGCFGGPHWFRAEVHPTTARRKLRQLDRTTDRGFVVAFVIG